MLLILISDLVAVLDAPDENLVVSVSSILSFLIPLDSVCASAALAGFLEVLFVLI